MKEFGKCDTSSFHIQLISKVINLNRYPFIRLIIENNISEKEYNDLMELLNGLNQTYHQQKEEGLIDFTTLLVRFAGMLNEKLNPNETIAALKKEGYYPSLMNEFTNIITRESKIRKR
ncbi:MULTISPECIES: DUF1878 family protein [Bacillaceae]|uniref:DUF1878 family protein n=1 Tax=Bacillaceae TaxID=186817 RepID=UPI000699E4E4|nr:MULTISPECIES: DUF1878 family protein [Bacillaceae]PZD84045.1 DUF1878 family protein [Bacilli bacterium]MBU8790379.1 YhaI family protein [Oceanobacillus caeni]MED4476426.1 DUF1878 family protein [Oceanobacillus caeni]PZD87690.1 DUF1878 family protein [Bacilli bacterium]PZD90729.1 DUF1878 family protein [Bacilli bacterium]